MQRVNMSHIPNSFDLDSAYQIILYLLSGATTFLFLLSFDMLHFFIQFKLSRFISVFPVKKCRQPYYSLLNKSHDYTTYIWFISVHCFNRFVCVFVYRINVCVLMVRSLHRSLCFICHSISFELCHLLNHSVSHYSTLKSIFN